MPRENGFENKRVVIIGGSSGIGLAVAEEAASQGAEVVVVSSKAERVQEAIRSIGGKARGQVVDVSDGSCRPTPAQWMGHCRKRLRNYRSLNTCTSDRIGADPGERRIPWSRPDEPVAEHELIRKGAAL